MPSLSLSLTRFSYLKPFVRDSSCFGLEEGETPAQESEFKKLGLLEADGQPEPHHLSFKKVSPFLADM